MGESGQEENSGEGEKSVGSRNGHGGHREGGVLGRKRDGEGQSQVVGPETERLALIPLGWGA